MCGFEWNSSVVFFCEEWRDSVAYWRGESNVNCSNVLVGSTGLMRNVAPLEGIEFYIYISFILCVCNVMVTFDVQLPWK